MPRQTNPGRAAAARPGRAASAAAGGAPAASPRWKASISRRAAASGTGTTLATIVRVPIASSAADEAEQLVARVAVREREVARGEDEHVRRAAQPLKVERGQRPVGELERREERAVGAEAAVTGDVRERGAVERAQRRVRRRRLPSSTVAPGWSAREVADLGARVAETRAGDERSPCAVAPRARAARSSQTDSDGATTTRPAAQRRAARPTAARAARRSGRRRAARRRSRRERLDEQPVERAPRRPARSRARSRWPAASRPPRASRPSAKRSHSSSLADRRPRRARGARACRRERDRVERAVELDVLDERPGRRARARPRGGLERPSPRVGSPRASA